MRKQPISSLITRIKPFFKKKEKKQKKKELSQYTTIYIKEK
nr:MAG TPA: hypothetical protein [Caudoviricetes sp.]